MKASWFVLIPFLPLFLSEGTSQEWRQIVASFCQAVNIPPFQPIRSIPLKNLSSFSTVAFGWELRNGKGQRAWAIVSLDGRLWELGLGTPWWQRWKGPLKERVLTRYGTFLSDGSWHWLYRGLGGYGIAVQKGMTVRVEARTLELWGDGEKDGVFPPQGKREPPFKGAPPTINRPFLTKGFPLLPTLRSSHATAAAMWAIGEGITLPKEPPPALIGSLSGVISRCLCDLPERPWVHELERGIPLFLKARGRDGSVQTFLHSQTPFPSLTGPFKRNGSALVTFTYLSEQVKKDAALLRMDGTTVLAIGYWESPSSPFLIALSPLPLWEKGKEKVRGLEEGVILYRWDGPATNVVVAFFSIKR